MRAKSKNPPPGDEELNLGWVLAELRADQLITRHQFEQLVFVAQREPHNRLHPLVQIAEKNWVTGNSPGKKVRPAIPSCSASSRKLS